jgi:type IV pilus assembly protein PilX
VSAPRPCAPPACDARDACAARGRARPVARARGFSLIIAMLMLAVIGLASAAIMRNATSGDQVANNNRLQTQASQYAQLALRFCESQLALAASSRSVTLLPATAAAAWTSPANWTDKDKGAGHTLSPAEIGSAVRPRVPPQCLMEATAAPGLYTVTARGFSADFKADPATGGTRNGSVVWLQATIYAQGEAGPPGAPGTAAGDAALIVRQRVWQQLLTPPF